MTWEQKLEVLVPRPTAWETARQVARDLRGDRLALGPSDAARTQTLLAALASSARPTRPRKEGRPISAVLLDDVARLRAPLRRPQRAQATRSRSGSRTRTPSRPPTCTPYLAITRAEKRSGKTRLLEVLELLVRQPLPTANISDAALFRVIDEQKPTLLVDEVDAIFGPRRASVRSCAGCSNAGYRRGADAHRMGGAQEHDPPDVRRVLPEGVRRDRRLSAGHDRRPRDRDPARAPDAGGEGRALPPRDASPRRRAPRPSDRLARAAAGLARRPGPTLPESSTTAPRTSGSRCSRSPTWPAATGRSVHVRRRSCSRAARSARTTR